MRELRLTFVARSFAALLLCLTASPVTAPFTACDLSEFTRPHRSGIPYHPGQQVAVPRLKASSHVTVGAVIAPVKIAPFEIAYGSQPPLQTILQGQDPRQRTILRI